MIKANQINDMEMANYKNQAKMAQSIQKLGRGRRKVKVYLSKASQKFLEQVIIELKKQMAFNQKQMVNVLQFFDYIINVLHVAKRTKRPKVKELALSYEEIDFLKLQINGTIVEASKQYANLKWYNLIKKLAYSSAIKQNKFLLDEINSK